ncbi:spore coat protein [Paenibacillus ihbetae]|uniref:Spore coat protein n=1 Tax=Paenibacillus ihbetae TaxID=1870820 RepID=A0A1B2DXI3_9BACL|nr:spore coat protein [Paenibacillus ihbetae]ANY72448.1 spore gernimation protein GerQ [Paenibacillus ihbetae]OOC58357.1 spore coat protein [Paenibacillus ihbetae]
MNTIIEYLTGMNAMSDQAVATDFLISAKSGIHNYAVALTETASPEIKAVLRQHLQEAIDTHEQIIHYMIRKGYYHPYHIQEQLSLDLQTAQTALNLPLR